MSDTCLFLHAPRVKILDVYNQALIAVCCAAIVAVALIFPGARLGFMLPAAAVCGAVALLAYLSCPFRTQAGAAVVILGYTLVVCGIFININYFTEVLGGSYSHPVLINEDAHADWFRAMNILYGEPIVNPREVVVIRYISYSAAALMWIFGRDIGVPLMFNALCYSMAVILVGAIAWQLTRSKKTATVAIAVTTLMCYLMAEATVFLKDVPLTMCMGAVALVMVRWRMHSRVTSGDILLLVPAVAAIAFLRTNMLMMVVLGLIVFAIRRRRIDMRFVWTAAGCVAAFFVVHIAFFAPDPSANIAPSEQTMSLFVTSNSQAFADMIGEEYHAMPLWKRLLWLPASVLVQFLIPFPWNFMRDTVFGPTIAVAHFGYFWYYAGAVLVYWIFALSRRAERPMQLLVFWGVLLYVATAYMNNGRVSRYCLPFLPLLLPAVASALTDSLRQRSFWIWMAVFTALLVPTLVVCHHLQMSA